LNGRHGWRGVLYGSGDAKGSFKYFDILGLFSYVKRNLTIGVFRTNEGSSNKKERLLLVIFTLLIFAVPGTALQEEKAEPKQPVPLEDNNDIRTWKSIRSPVLSNDGKWIAYRVAPAEGDGEVIIKELTGEKEYTFPVGESRSSA
jgi:hypothetical protein